ncbi:MAG TPA: carbonic anhydrase [Vicinamibacterales bacterium]|nr:carbonic anhydrase [Vicinamibacterales bacterium]
MSSQRIGRREWCQGVLAFSGLAAAGLSAEQQKPAVMDPRMDELIRRGATMEEVAKLKDPVATNPDEAIRALKMGNARFFGGQAQRPEASAAERRAQILGQTPFGVVLSCSDSRVPTEIVFDQGLGDLFITRVAGNVVDRTTLGSIEYAVGHLKTHVVVVMGHEGCGAVKAALLPPEERARETENIQFLLNQIVPSLQKLPAIRDEKAKMREAVIANVRVQVQNLKKGKFVQDAIRSKKIAVIGAFYEITSGAVDFLETEEELRVGSGLERGSRWREHLL